MEHIRKLTVLWLGIPLWQRIIGALALGALTGWLLGPLVFITLVSRAVSMATTQMPCTKRHYAECPRIRCQPPCQRKEAAFDHDLPHILPSACLLRAAPRLQSAHAE